MSTAEALLETLPILYYYHGLLVSWSLVFWFRPYKALKGLIRPLKGLIRPLSAL